MTPEGSATGPVEGAVVEGDCHESLTDLCLAGPAAAKPRPSAIVRSKPGRGTPRWFLVPEVSRFKQGVTRSGGFLPEPWSGFHEMRMHSKVWRRTASPAAVVESNPMGFTAAPCHPTCVTEEVSIPTERSRCPRSRIAKLWVAYGKMCAQPRETTRRLALGGSSTS
jgi:hypothetical protein